MGGGGWVTIATKIQGPLNGGVSNGGASRSGLVLPFLSFLVLSDYSGIFPICSGMVRGFSRFVPFLFLGLLRAPRGNSPERVRDTIWTFTEKSGKPPGLETPRFSFSQKMITKNTLQNNCFGTINFVNIAKQSLYKTNSFACSQG